MGVRRTFRLGEHVGDADTLKHSTHSAAGLHTGTLGSGLQENAAAAEFSCLLVGNGTFVYRYADEVLLGCLYALGDSRLDFVGLTETPADDSILVADNHDGCEAECAATLGDLGHTVDCYKAILKIEIASCLYSVIFGHVVG